MVKTKQHVSKSPQNSSIISVEKKEPITSDMSLNINSNNRISSNWVKKKLLGIKIDSRLNFEPHVSDLCKSAARQLNALLRLKSYLIIEVRKF